MFYKDIQSLNQLVMTTKWVQRYHFWCNSSFM